MQSYETIYASHVRAAGLISPADITSQLAARAADTSELAALDWRAQVAYRIDQQFDHWLLDEFQDTSRSQWAILRAFIDEALMDESARRSFFYVGDTKQAIYGWRGGDASLFHEICDHYENIAAAPPLTHSWRATQPVIDLINQVFGHLPAHAEALKLPPDTLDRWADGWNEHQVAAARADRNGYAAWLPVPKSPESETPPQFAKVLDILRQIDPITRNIECAALLRQNKDVAALAASLQEAGIPVVVEGKSNPCTDNLLGSAVLAALRAAAHPADSHAAAIARGMPCASAWGLDDLDSFRSHTLQAIAEHGYAQTLQRWITAASLPSRTSASSAESPSPIQQDTSPPLSPFLTSRAEALLIAAEAYDARATRAGGIDDFIAYVESLKLSEAETTGAIRLMTVHQAKGLGFEMVLVCGLDRIGKSNTADELVLGPDPTDPEWGLLLPRRNVAEADPLLRAIVERLQAESKTEELCNAYVALTRAKRALYVIADELPENSKASHFGRHLALTLGSQWEAGDSNWFRP